jgi:hypothetical protein
MITKAQAPLLTIGSVYIAVHNCPKDPMPRCPDVKSKPSHVFNVAQASSVRAQTRPGGLTTLTHRLQRAHSTLICSTPPTAALLSPTSQPPCTA